MSRVAIGTFVVVAFLCASLQAQSPGQVAQRLSGVEATVKDLVKQIAELTDLVRTFLPPSPIEDVSAFEVSISDSATRGTKNAKVALIEWSDFQCPFCGQTFRDVYPELQRSFIDSGHVLYVFRNLPLEGFHPLALKAAEAAECARRQGRFWEMHDQLFSHQQALELTAILDHAETLPLDIQRFRWCLVDGKPTGKIREDLAEARRLGVTGTPTFMIGELTGTGTVLVTKKIVGAQKLQVFRTALDAALAKSNALDRD